MGLPIAGIFTVLLAHSRSLAGLRRWQEGGGGVANDDGGLDPFTFWLFIGMTIFLVLMAGAMSGLTLGLMSLDVVDLEILKRSGTVSQQKCAERIVPVLQRPHVLLVTLLVCNAAAAEALPLFLDRLADPITAVLVSVTVVLLFGEIIPQALCSRFGLQIGAAAAPFVRVLMIATAPVSYPIGWVLDRILGERHSALFRRAELKALVDIHKEGQEFGGVLSADEVNIIKGALDMTHKIAKSAMTPMDMVFMLPADAVLDESTFTAILASGHSRIPVHKPGNRGEILGILLVKELIMVEKDARLSVGQIKIRSLPYLRADTPLYDMLKLFEIGRSHMAVLTQPTAAALARRARAAARAKLEQRHILLDIDSDDYSGGEEEEEEEEGDDESPVPNVCPVEYDPSEVEAVGIITIEDVLEELLQSEIVDETDQYIDNMHVERVNAALLARGLPPHLRRALTTHTIVPRIGDASVMGGGLAIAVASQRSVQDALAAGAKAAEAGVFSSPRAASEDRTAAEGPRIHKVTFGPPSVVSPTRRATTTDAEIIAAAAAVLSPRTSGAAAAGGGGAGARLSSSASLVSMASHQSTATAREAAAAAALNQAAERQAARAAAVQAAGRPPKVPVPSRRTQQLTQGIQEQMDLLQPLLRRVRTADAMFLREHGAEGSEEHPHADLRTDSL